MAWAGFLANSVQNEIHKIVGAPPMGANNELKLIGVNSTRVPKELIIVPTAGTIFHEHYVII